MKVNKNTNVTKRGYTQCPLPAKQLKIKKSTCKFHIVNYKWLGKKRTLIKKESYKKEELIKKESGKKGT